MLAVSVIGSSSFSRVMPAHDHTPTAARHWRYPASRGVASPTLVGRSLGSAFFAECTGVNAAV